MKTVANTTPNAASAEVDAHAERFMEAHAGVTYREAVHAVLAADKQLAEAYAAPSARVTPRRLRPRPQAPAPVQMAQGIPAGQTVHSRAVALVDEHPHLDYRAAVHQVLEADPALKAQYAGVPA
jgi:hypothetical protein